MSRNKCEVCKKKLPAKRKDAVCCGHKCCTSRWRKTLRGRLCTIKSNIKHKRPDIDKVCRHCEKPFTTARKMQSLCSVCSPIKSGYYAQQDFQSKLKEGKAKQANQALIAALEKV